MHQTQATRGLDSGPSVQGRPTEAMAVDCEMVGVGTNSRTSALARVAVVNSKLECVYHAWVKPTDKVTDYRTEFSGVRPEDIQSNGAVSFRTAQKAVGDLLKGRLLVGHSVHNDLRVLKLHHPAHKIWDSSKDKRVREAIGSPRNPPALKRLAAGILGEQIQRGKHNPVEDATAAMKLSLPFSAGRKQQVQKNTKNAAQPTKTQKQNSNQKTKNAAQKTAEKKAAQPTSAQKQNSQQTVKKAAQPTAQKNAASATKAAQPAKPATRQGQQRQHNRQSHQTRQGHRMHKRLHNRQSHQTRQGHRMHKRLHNQPSQQTLQGQRMQQRQQQQQSK